MYHYIVMLRFTDRAQRNKRFIGILAEKNVPTNTPHCVSLLKAEGFCRRVKRTSKNRYFYCYRTILPSSIVFLNWQWWRMDNLVDRCEPKFRESSRDEHAEPVDDTNGSVRAQHDAQWPLDETRCQQTGKKKSRFRGSFSVITESKQDSVISRLRQHLSQKSV